MALQVEPRLLAGRAVGEGNMVICDFVEEMDLVLSQQQSRGDRMDWRITPSLVEEAAIMVQGVEIIQISLGPHPVQASDFEIRPLQESVCR